MILNFGSFDSRSKWVLMVQCEQKSALDTGIDYQATTRLNFERRSILPSTSCSSKVLSMISLSDITFCVWYLSMISLIESTTSIFRSLDEWEMVRYFFLIEFIILYQVLNIFKLISRGNLQLFWSSFSTHYLEFWALAIEKRLPFYSKK